MKRPWEVWAVIVFQLLFALCASSVLAYRVLGIDFDFGLLSYRVFNITISLTIIAYLVFALLKGKRLALVFALVFSAFHFVEGIIISFWLKVVIHGFVLLVIGAYFIRKKSILLGESA